ncbi:TPA: hypothetical protein EYP66_13675, partial [Candidatus Poribacteria bacterium]|nr:hypothetical protein [Candidatus Poribacteria bacterium]
MGEERRGGSRALADLGSTWGKEPYKNEDRETLLVRKVIERYRIVDLSAELHPGVLKVNGEYVHGKESRRFEIRQFVYAPDKAFMHWVETETHVGT